MAAFNVRGRFSGASGQDKWMAHPRLGLWVWLVRPLVSQVRGPRGRSVCRQSSQRERILRVGPKLLQWPCLEQHQG